MINSKLQDLKTPIQLKGQGPVTIELTRDRGRLWVNDSTGCLVRICMLPPESIVTFNPETKYLDITVQTVHPPNLIEALKGLMEIAEKAMPDTYFESDSRVNKARKVLARVNKIGGE